MWRTVSSSATRGMSSKELTRARCFAARTPPSSATAARDVGDGDERGGVGALAREELQRSRR